MKTEKKKSQETFKTTLGKQLQGTILQQRLLAIARFFPATDMPGKKVNLYNIPTVTG